MICGQNLPHWPQQRRRWQVRRPSQRLRRERGSQRDPRVACAVRHQNARRRYRRRSYVRRNERCRETWSRKTGNKAGRRKMRCCKLRACNMRCRNGAGASTTTRLEDAHSTKFRELLYPWHPWSDLRIGIHEAIERPGGVVFRCDLTASEANRWPSSVDV